MAKAPVRFKVGGKRTELGKAVENLTKRMTRFSNRAGSQTNTKEIRNQVRRMIEKEGKTEKQVIYTLNQIRNERLREIYVDKNTGELITNISDMKVSPVDVILDMVGMTDEEDIGGNGLLLQWLTDAQNHFEEDLDDVLLNNSTEIQAALNSVIWGYLEKGTTQGIETSLTRLYEVTFGKDFSFNMKKSIEERVMDYQIGYYTGRTYGKDELE